MRITPVLLLLLAACSTAPKNPGDIYDIRTQAESQLEMGSKAADRGNYDTALVLLNEAWRLAVITDNPALLVRIGLSRGNLLFALGRSEEAAAEWETALGEAEKRGTPELAAISRIHIARGRLLAAADPASLAAQVRAGVEQELPALKSDKLSTAFSWVVIGLCERDLGRYREAESAVNRSREIHEKERYFEQTAYDWYLIASFRSLSGNYQSALEALEAARDFDRRVENGWGLATDWRALGDVYKKAGMAPESREAYHRAAAIFRALGNDAEAAAVERRAE
jgi:tetratricopeptide (TPR) repeat protein